jgi:phosphohistidine phosphatase
MELYLIRHAEAAALEDAGVESDEERPLTEAGREQAKLLATGLQKRGVELHLLVTSPLVRAQQTAEGMLQNWSGPAPELLVCEELEPGLRPKKLTRYLRKLEGERIGLVGHMPDLGHYAAWLLGFKQLEVDLAKAGVACVSCLVAPGKGSGKLEWLVTPAWLG